MHLSKNISNLSLSPTVSLNAKAQALKSQGISILNFAVGEPDFPTPKPIVDIAIESLKNGHTRYGNAGGGLTFRQAIVDKLKRENGLTYDPNDIVCGIGAKEILFHTFLAALNPGDEVILSAPCWVSYKEQIQACGAIPVVIPLPTKPNEPLVCSERIEPYASKRTVAIVICSPNNPAGYVLSEHELAQLGRYLASKDWLVISDEIYEYLVFNGMHRSLGQIEPRLKDRFVHINGMSKGFAMTGWRVGYGAGPRELMRLVRSLQSHSSTCIPPFIEEAATWAIKQGREFVSFNNVETMRRRRDLAISCLKEIKGISWIDPQGAFYILVDIREVLGSLDTLRFCEKLLVEYHIAVVPGEAFEAAGFVRLSYACDEQTICNGIKKFGQAIASLR